MAVSFSNFVEVFTGQDETLDMVSQTVEHQLLCQAHAKPWGWTFSSLHWDYNFDLELLSAKKVVEALSGTAVNCGRVDPTVA